MILIALSPLTALFGAIFSYFITGQDPDGIPFMIGCLISMLISSGMLVGGAFMLQD